MCRGIINVHEACEHDRHGEWRDAGEWDHLASVCSARYDYAIGQCRANKFKQKQVSPPDWPVLCKECMSKGATLVEEFLEEERYDLRKHLKAAKQALVNEERNNGHDRFTKLFAKQPGDDDDVSVISDDDNGYLDVDVNVDADEDENEEEDEDGNEDESDGSEQSYLAAISLCRMEEEYEYLSVVTEFETELKSLDGRQEQTWENYRSCPTDFYSVETEELVKGCFKDPILESKRRYKPEGLILGYGWSEEFAYGESY